MTPGDVDRAQPARIAGILLVLVQCATLAFLETGYLFGGITAGLALLSLIPALRFPARQAPHWLWYALLGVILAIKYRFAPEKIEEQITFFNTVMAYEAARYLIFLQVTQLYVERPGGRIPAWFAGLACAGMVFASNVRISSANEGLAQGLCLAFVAGLGSFAHFSRAPARGRGRLLAAGALSVVMLAVMLTGAGTARLLQSYEDDLEKFLVEQTSGTNSEISRGFSGRGAIGDITGWKRHAENHIALRIEAETVPGYLRGMAFDSFQHAFWTSNVDRHVIGTFPVDWPQPLRVGDELYRLTDEIWSGPVTGTLNIWPDDRTGARLFSPLNAGYIATTPASIGIDDHDLVTRIEPASSDPFTLFLVPETAASPLAPALRDRCLFVEADLREDLLSLSQDVLGGFDSTSQKIRAITDFFHSNFEYALLPQVGRGENLLTRFLRGRAAGHCELFATSGAILLRLAGVPTRYVTGYVATERNQTGGYWIARRRDAHAWIEAYDDDLQQWVTVECTPPEGVPHHDNTAGGWSDWWDARQLQFQQWLHRVTSGGLIELWSLIASVPGLTILLGTIIAAVLWMQGSAPRLLPRPRRPDAYPLLARTLRRCDRLARRCGYERRAEETLSAFADRLRSLPPGKFQPSALADWYEQYVQVRYGKSQSDPQCAELARQLQVTAVSVRSR